MIRPTITDDVPCCSAGRDADVDAETVNDERPTAGTTSSTRSTDVDTARMVRLDGRPFTMGTDDGVGFPADGEGPAREVDLNPFYTNTYAVTNAEFLHSRLMQNLLQSA